MHYILVGPSGSGKSVTAPKLAAKLGILHIDTDVAIEEQRRLAIPAIFKLEGEDAFRRLEESVIRNILSHTEPAVIATGGGLPTIPGLMAYLNSHATTIYLKASIDVLWDRVTMEEDGLLKRPLLQKGGRTALTDMVDRREPIYNKSRCIIETDELEPDEIVAVICNRLKLVTE